MGTEPGLVAYYNFNTTTKDVTGRGHDGTLMYFERYTTPGALLRDKPEISVEQPPGTELADGFGKQNFGSVTVGMSSVPRDYIIKNTGTKRLTNLAVNKAGTHFLVTGPAETSLGPGESTTLSVIFKPMSTGTKNAMLRIFSNDTDENPFDISLTGTGVD